jgi:hypothetical protein
MLEIPCVHNFRRWIKTILNLSHKISKFRTVDMFANVGTQENSLCVISRYYFDVL